MIRSPAEPVQLDDVAEKYPVPRESIRFRYNERVVAFKLLCVPVLKCGCESWTVNTNLMKRINAFEEWCYRRMLKISWKDKVPNAEVLKRVGEKEQQFYRKSVQQKLAYAGHVLIKRKQWKKCIGNTRIKNYGQKSKS